MANSTLSQDRPTAGNPHLSRLPGALKASADSIKGIVADRLRSIDNAIAQFESLPKNEPVPEELANTMSDIARWEDLLTDPESDTEYAFSGLWDLVFYAKDSTAIPEAAKRRVITITESLAAAYTRLQDVTNRLNDITQECAAIHNEIGTAEELNIPTRAVLERVRSVYASLANVQERLFSQCNDSVYLDIAGADMAADVLLGNLLVDAKGNTLRPDVAKPDAKSEAIV